MKEIRYFHDPDLTGNLPEDEARHATRVLRLKEGDELHLVDGRGTRCVARITVATNHQCLYEIVERVSERPTWKGHLHLALAPTKMMERTEWLAEKATEVGLDELSLLDCRWSERRQVKTDRLEKILVAAMKQSHKATLPRLNGMTPFADFVTEERVGQKFICHCHEGDKPFLLDVLDGAEDATVLVGPEGDFSPEEVALALQHGYRAVSLGPSRLRTETAALMAVHMMQLAHMNKTQ